VTEGDETEQLDGAVGGPGALPGATVQACAIEVVEGPSEKQTWSSRGEKCAIGSHAGNDLVLSDRTVSRFHCEVRLCEEGATVADLGSRNGTKVDGVTVMEAWLRDGSFLKLGETSLQIRFAGGGHSLKLSPRTRFGNLVGRSVPMRATFAQLEAAARTDSTVLLIGETGTGKEEVAQSLHELGERSEAPLVVVDCGAMPEGLLESELFGHERGAFTGAVAARVGAFESASGGTIFLDEIGEMPLELQPRLLRVLERREVRRVGSNETREIDVRVIAATNRDLRAEVNEGRFREDLYYRLAVIEIELPPLRERPEDIPLIAEALIDRMHLDEDARSLLDDDVLSNLARGSWPGNVRQLRNYLAHFAALREPPPGATLESTGSATVDARVPYERARRHALLDFERRYLVALLDLYGDNVTEAARTAGMNRAYLYRLLRRHGLR
jgi:transcriptional regulator with GAF, ATPase, and Fis domain